MPTGQVLRTPVHGRDNLSVADDALSTCSPAAIWAIIGKAHSRKAVARGTSSVHSKEFEP